MSERADHEPDWIDLEGAANVRDLGGLPSRAGRTRPGVLLRADALDALSPADVAELAERRGLVHVVDLRSDGERLERGRGLLGQRHTVRYTELQIIDEAQLEARRLERETRLAAGVPRPEIMADGYAQLLEWGSAAFSRAFGLIAAPDGAPALVHCSAGKDRTGVLIALLLGAAGVADGAIVADYAATGARMAGVIERLRTAERFQYMAGELPAFVFDAPAETMERFLDHLRRGWGGAAGWLSAYGIDDATLAGWQQRLVSPS